MDFVKLRAYAKINLAIDVLRKRGDGYHDVRMIMQTVDLYDKLEIHRRGKQGIHITTNLSYLPINENNLIHKAARLFMEACQIEAGVYVKLKKKIPVAAGLAGGSSDAAATLLGMNNLFGTELTLPQLQEIGVKIGADVPYCLLGGTALSEGIGEILTPLPAAPRLHCLLVKPQISVSTKQVYKSLVLDESICHPDVDSMIEAITEKNIAKMCAGMGNVLESVTVANHSVITKIKQEILSHGAVGALMSGSGPTVFGLFDDAEAARKAYYSFKVGHHGGQTFLTEFCKGEA